MTNRSIGAVVLLGAAAAAGCPSDPEAKPCEPSADNMCVYAGNGMLGLDDDDVRGELSILEARLYWPIDVEVSPTGEIWVLDWNNHLIRRVTPDGRFEDMVGYFVGDGPDDLSDLMAPGAPGLTVALNHPTDIQFAPDGSLWFAAWHNHKIRRLDVATGLVTVLAGRGAGFQGDGGPLAMALFNQPKAITFAPDGSMYLLDQRNHRIRRIAADNTISTVVGTGMAGFGGDGGPPLMAQLQFEAGGNPEPSGALAVGPDGALYISDGLNHRIRKVDFAADTIDTIAGTGEAGFSGDGGPAVAAQINNARDMEIGPDGRLWFADTENHRIRAIDLTAGTIETVIGSGETEPNEGVPPLEINLNRPMGIAFAADGTTYVADTFNSRVLVVTR